MRLLVGTILVLALHGATWGQTFLIHPFASEGSLLGTVVADRVAQGLRDDADLVIGPAAAPALVPPVVFGDGFLGPLAVLEPEGVTRLHGAMLLAAGVGVDVAASGRVVADADGLRLDLVAAWSDGSTLRATLRAPEDDPAELARRAASTLALRSGLPVPQAPAAIDMAGSDDALGRALTLLAGGFTDEAASLLETAAAADGGDARLDALRTTMQAVEAGRPADDVPLAAALALTVLADDERTIAYLEALGESGVPAAHAWIGAIAANVNDLSRADAAYARAEQAYPYGAAAAAAYRHGFGRDDVGADPLDSLATSADPAALVVAVLLAELEERPELEARALDALARAAPTFPWPFERASYRAFDDDDPLAAAQALIIATELEPDSDLYWTNLGWAWYLLGFWERSEAASERALELDPGAYIAGYNLGLVRARQGRLDDAMGPYRASIAADPEIDDEALADVENAILERPHQPALHYVAGRLYEAEGRRAAAADAYERYLELGGWGPPYDTQAEQRVEALRAPPPPLEIAGSLAARLGPVDVDDWRPGDPVRLRFEVITPGDALPSSLRVRAEVVPEGGGRPVTSATADVDVPADAIGLVVDEVRFELPEDLEPGSYQVRLVVGGAEDQEARATVTLEVAGDASVVRRLVGRGVVFTALQTGRSLLAAADLTRPDAAVDRLLREVHAAAAVADEALPRIESGRFEGTSGGEAFERSDAQDVRDFLRFAESEGLRDVRLTFVDAYAQWLVDGAPAP